MTKKMKFRLIYSKKMTIEEAEQIFLNSARNAFPTYRNGTLYFWVY